MIRARSKAEQAANAAAAATTDEAHNIRNGESGTSSAEVGHGKKTQRIAKSSAVARAKKEALPLRYRTEVSRQRDLNRLRKVLKTFQRAHRAEIQSGQLTKSGTCTDLTGHRIQELTKYIAQVERAEIGKPVTQTVNLNEEAITLPPTPPAASDVELNDAASGDVAPSDVAPSDAQSSTNEAAAPQEAASPAEPSPAAADTTEAAPTGNSDSDAPKLIGQKLVAMMCLLQGQTNTAAAEVAGVDRRTIYRWRQEPEFQAELHRIQRQRCAAMRSSLAALADDSVEVLSESLRKGDAKAAIELLNSTQILRGQPLTELDDIYRCTSPDPAAPFTSLASYEPMSETNSCEEGVYPDQLRFVHPQAADAATLPTALSVKSQTEVDLLDMTDLPIPQQLALGELLAGKALYEAAQKAGVAPVTVERWLHCNQSFRQVLRDCRYEQMTCVQTRLLNLGKIAVQVLEFHLKHRRNRQVAFAVLKGLGLM